MGGASSAYGQEKRYIKDFGGEMRERDRLEDPGLDGKITLR